MSKAVLFFADGTEECEALLVADLLRRAKVEVIIASAMGRRALVSSHGKMCIRDSGYSGSIKAPSFIVFPLL